MPDDSVPTGQTGPVGTRKYPKRPHEEIDDRVSREDAIQTLTGKFGTQEPANTAVLEKLER
ncbi:hypothetical protein H0H93_006323, partial [Arthromyces matolae]